MRYRTPLVLLGLVLALASCSIWATPTTTSSPLSSSTGSTNTPFPVTSPSPEPALSALSERYDDVVTSAMAAVADPLGPVNWEGVPTARYRTRAGGCTAWVSVTGGGPGPASYTVTALAAALNPVLEAHGFPTISAPTYENGWVVVEVKDAYGGVFSLRAKSQIEIGVYVGVPAARC